MWISVGGGNQPPVIHSLTGPTSGETCQYYQYTVSASDPDGDILEYKWTWPRDPTGFILGGKDWAPGQTQVDIEWGQAGTYWVKVEIRDNHYHWVEETLNNIVIVNSQPTADAGGDQNGYTGVELTFNAGGSTGNNIEYRWNFDYQGYTFWNEKISDPITTHRYYDPGTYTVRLRVVDECNHYDEDTITVTITDYV